LRRAPARARTLLTDPLHHRDFRLLWTGMTVSLLGDGITLVAIAWQAYAISSAPAALAVVGVAQTVPAVVLLLVGGAVSDRFDRRNVMVAADSLRMLAVLAMAGLSLSGQIRIWHMVVIAAFYGAGTAFFSPAFDALVPELVSEQELTQANALDQFVRPAAFRMFGPALGGILISAFGGPGGAFLIDGMTFLTSILCLLAMRRPQRASAVDEDRSSMVREIGEGLRYVRSRVWLWGTFLAATLAYLVFWGPAEVLVPYVVKVQMERSAGELGLVLALGGIGAMSAAVLMARREVPRHFMTFMYACWTVSTLMVAGYGFARLPWQIMAASFLFNALESAGLVVWMTTKQRFVPGRLLGRVSSLDQCISIGLIPLSFAITGPLAEAFGVRATLIGAGLLGAAITLGFLFVPGMRDLERAGDAAPASASTTVDGGAGLEEARVSVAR
jgi:MFS family permease